MQQQLSSLLASFLPYCVHTLAYSPHFLCWLVCFSLQKYDYIPETPNFFWKIVYQIGTNTNIMKTYWETNTNNSNNTNVNNSVFPCYSCSL